MALTRAANGSRIAELDGLLLALDFISRSPTSLSARPLAGDDERPAFASRDDAQRAAAVQLEFATV